MRGNTISINLGYGRTGQTGKLFQFDRGQHLIIEGCPLPELYTVHFSNDILGKSKPMIGNSEGVGIPDEYLESGKDIHVWVYVIGEDHAETEYHGVIYVTPRAEPTDIEPTPAEKTLIDQIVEDLNNAVTEVEDAVENIQQTIDDALEEAKESGEFDGKTPEKGIDYWTAEDKQEIIDEISIINVIDDDAGIGTKAKSWSADKLTTEFNKKADKEDTVLDTTLSRGRKGNSSSGAGSLAFGNNVEASGDFSYATGDNTAAKGYGSTSEGNATVANGRYSRVEGEGTIAAGADSRVSGKYNVADSYSSWPEWIPGKRYVLGDRIIRSVGGNINAYVCKIANSDTTFLDRKWINQNGIMTYAEIVGNGVSDNGSISRSNARALDWNGNEYLSGNVYVNCESNSSGGDKLSTVNEVDSKIASAIHDISSFDIEIVSELPEHDIKDHTFYLVPIQSEEEENIYEEYLYINNHWELMGTTAPSLVDLIDDNSGTGVINKTWSANKINTNLNKKYEKPFNGIPASDLEIGIIPVLEDVIDDTAGDGDNNVTWSADKLAGIEERLANLEYVPIALNSFSVSPNLAEKGSTQTTATLTYSMNRAATQMKLDNAVISNTAASGTIPLTGLSLTSNKTWTLKATDERKSQSDEWVSRSATMTFTNKVKYGAGYNSGVFDGFLNSLPTRTLSTGKVRSFTVTTGPGEYIWYALPSSYGACTFTVGGFTGGFSLVSTFNHTNESGYTTEYNVYRSDNPDLGTKTVTVD